MKKWIALLLTISVLGVSSWVCFKFYSFIFAKNVRGTVEAIEKLDLSASILARGDLPSQLFSYAVSVRDLKTNEIFTSSTEDRAWGTIVKGNCVEARFFPHPPWDLEKGGTFQKTRLEKRFDCPEVSGLPIKSESK